MSDEVERWIQGELFGYPARPRWRRRPAPPRRDFSRVASDPAVALAGEESRRLASGVKMGLAMILAQRSPEERAALRALFERQKVA
ncbi:MAG: hypothetical protein M1401_07865 [Chloroflexi bacterium]|nr:hypothetical protein [Chloroflexota bacterium]